MSVTIRPLVPSDENAWWPLWRGYQTFYRVEIPHDVGTITWSRLLDATEPMGGAIAWCDEAALGLVHHIRHRSCWTSGDYVYLQDLFVVPDARGRGVGRALIEHVCEVAKADNCSRVHWLTHETNTDAMKLYDRIGERSGFVQYRKLLAPI